MRGMGSKYDYEALEYQAEDNPQADTYFAATPCRAVLHAETVKSRATLLPEKPTSLLKKAFGRS